MVEQSRIIDYERIVRRQKRGNIMYEELVRRLESAPAAKCTIQDAENLADEVLKTFGCTDNDTLIPIVKIANAFHFKTYKISNLPEDISGSIFIGGTTEQIYKADKVIIVGDTEPLPHQRFIVAHELAHYLLDYIGNEKFKNHNILFQRTYPKVNHNSPEEIRADRFAAELLMPKKVFLAEYTKVMELTDYEKAYAIPYLSKIFGVKETSISRRIQEVIG